MWTCLEDLETLQSMSSSVYQNILESNGQSIWQLKLGWNRVINRTMILNTAANLTTEYLKKKRVKVLQWFSHSPDVNLVEMVWWNLKRAVHEHITTSLSALKQHCKEEWDKIPPRWCERLMTSHRKWLLQVFAAKGGSKKLLNLEVDLVFTHR